MVKGISLTRLLGMPGSTLASFPEDVRKLFDAEIVYRWRATVSDHAFVHEGVLIEGGAQRLLGFSQLPIELPLLNAGLPFRATFRRDPPQSSPPAVAVDGTPTALWLDLDCRRIRLLLPGLTAAKKIQEPASPPRLVADPGANVYLVGACILRIEIPLKGGSFGIRLVDAVDPFAGADGTAGPVLTFTCEPTTFLLANGPFGMEVDKLVVDMSERYTPAEAVARGLSEAWQGIGLHRAIVYFPPDAPFLPPNLSAGVEDLWLGVPPSLTGTLRAAFGRTLANGTKVQIHYVADGVEKGVADVPLGAAKTVLEAPEDALEAYLEVVSIADQQAAFWTGEGGRQIGGKSSKFPLTSMRELGCALVFKEPEAPIDGEPLIGERVTFHVDKKKASAAGASATTPPAQTRITATVGGTAYDGVASILAGESKRGMVTLTAIPPGGTWQVGETSPWTPALADLSVGVHQVLYSPIDGPKRRVRVEIVPGDADVCVGATSLSLTPGVVTNADQLLDLDAFHRTGSLNGNGGGFSSAVATTTTTVASGVLGRFPIVPPVSSLADPVPDTVSVHFQFDRSGRATDDLFGFRLGNSGPIIAGTPADIESRLTTWLGSWNGTLPAFTIDGHSDDLGKNDRNFRLMSDRATSAKAVLLDAVAAMAQPPSPPTITVAGSTNRSPPENAAVNARTAEIVATPPRPSDRRADITAMTSAPERPAAAERFLYIPGPEPTPPAPIAPTPPGGAPTPLPPPKAPYAVDLKLVWDSATLASWADAVPTLAEAKVTWVGNAVKIPGADDKAVVVQEGEATPSASVLSTWSVLGRWTCDVRTGATSYAAELVFPANKRPTVIGAIAVDALGNPLPASGMKTERLLAVAAALGPPLLAVLPASSAGAKVGSVAALLVATGAASKLLDEKQPTRLELHRLYAETVLGGDSHVRLQCDYEVKMSVSAKLGSLIGITGTDMRLKYRNVGVEVDWDADRLKNVNLDYGGYAIDVVDSGVWKLGGSAGGALSSLLRVTGVRIGTGSTWFEVTLGLKLDLGPVRISSAVVRITVGAGGSVSAALRGLEIVVDIESVLYGKGALKIKENGDFAGMLGVRVEPAGIEARASVVMSGSLLGLEIGVLFPVAIPLLSTGLGLYGVIGRLVVNGSRALGTSADPIGREVEWFKKSLDDKYAFKQGQWAIGLGAVIGTLADGGRAFNAIGSIVVEIPDPSVVFGIDARFLAPPSIVKEASDEPPKGVEMTLLGLVAIDKTVVNVGIRGSYVIPKLLKVSVPIDGHFPLTGTDPLGAYVHIGSDGQAGRPGSPVSVVFLPEVLNLTVTAYLMIRENGIPQLGGSTISLYGFSIGFGARAEFSWSAGPIKLSAMLRVLVGIGTKPFLLAGSVRLEGELSLVIISVSVSAELTLMIGDAGVSLHGEVCGRVKFLFFEVGGCIDFTLSTADAPQIDVPSPIKRVAMTDPLGVETGEAIRAPATAEDPQEGKAIPVVWPDTVPVISFNHGVDEADKPAWQGAQWTASGKTEPTHKPWSGTDELKYAWRLDSVLLFDITTGEPVLVTRPDQKLLPYAWWLPAHRPGVVEPAAPSAGAQPSEHEGFELGLLSANPAPWQTALPNGAEGSPGDPVKTIESLCEPVAPPRRRCAFGLDLQVRMAGMQILSRPGPAGEPRILWKVAATFPGFDSLADALSQATALLLEYIPATVTTVAFSAWIDEQNINGWMAPARLRSACYGLDVIAVTELSPDVALDSASVRLVWIPDEGAERAGAQLGYPPGSGKEQRRAKNGVRSAVTRMQRITHADTTMPVVIGYTAAGEAVPFPATVENGVVTQVRFESPPGGPWTRLEIVAPVGHNIGLVSVCGIPLAAVIAVKNEEDTRKAIEDKIAQDKKNLMSSILLPGRTYRIDAQWTGVYAAKSKTGVWPPATVDFSTGKSTTESFTFQTAPVAPVSEAATPPALTGGPVRTGPDESVFRPDELSRYLLGFTPGDNAGPHLVDDPIQVHFRVQHVPELLAAYDWREQFAVVRTDPPAGAKSTPEGEAALTQLPKRARRTRAQAPHQAPLYDRMRNAAQAHRELHPECDVDLPLGAITKTLSVKLEPNARYDVLFQAADVGPGQRATVTIARVAIRTSRYHNRAELLAALGFASGTSRIDDDLIVPLTAWPTSDAPGTFDATMATLGLPGQKPSERARTVALWSSSNQLIGLLIEAPEPILRDQESIGGTIEGSTIASAATIALVTKDLSATRLLLAVSPPIDAQFRESATVTLSLGGAASASAGIELFPNAARLE
jgi:hypothetical protein